MRRLPEVGETVVATPLREDYRYRIGFPRKPCVGTVVSVHSRGTFCTVRFDFGGRSFRESFRARDVKGEDENGL